MQTHTNQAEHNQNFHDCICNHFPNGFYDWKVTSVFYIAIHHLKGLALQKGIHIGESHGDIRNNVRSRSGKGKPLFEITQNAYAWYDMMYESSRKARYQGFTDAGTFQLIMEAEHKTSLEALSKFKKYVEKRRQ